MKMQIVASEALKRQTLEADDEGISIHETSGFGMGEWYHHAFGEIDAVVRTTSNPAFPTLSIQVGRTIYSIRYKSTDAGHQSLVDHIVAHVQRTTQEPT